MNGAEPAVATNIISKRYGDVAAVDGVDLRIKPWRDLCAPRTQRRRKDHPHPNAARHGRADEWKREHPRPLGSAGRGRLVGERRIPRGDAVGLSRTHRRREPPAGWRLRRMTDQDRVRTVSRSGPHPVCATPCPRPSAATPNASAWPRRYCIDHACCSSTNPPTGSIPQVWSRSAISSTTSPTSRRHHPAFQPHPHRGRSPRQPDRDHPPWTADRGGRRWRTPRTADPVPAGVHTAQRYRRRRTAQRRHQPSDKDTRQAHPQRTQRRRPPGRDRHPAGPGRLPSDPPAGRNRGTRNVLPAPRRR